MANIRLIFISTVILILLAVHGGSGKSYKKKASEIGDVNDVHRDKRSTPARFQKAHILSQKTFDNLLNSNKRQPGQMANNFQNLLKNINAKTPNVRDPYDKRAKHTFIVGDRKDILSSVRNQPVLNPKGARGSNLALSSTPFKQVQIQRTGNGGLTIREGHGKFAAGINQGNRPNIQNGKALGLPVHFEANPYKAFLNNQRHNQLFQTGREIVKTNVPPSPKGRNYTPARQTSWAQHAPRKGSS